MRYLKPLLILVALFVQGAFAAPANETGTGVSQSLPVEVVFETSEGAFTVELYPDKAPETVANFLAYVDEGFYDGTVFHRIIRDFVIQGGGFEKGMVRKTTRKPIKNESGSQLKNLTGTIAMARKTHPDTATSQFFINLNYNSSLDWKAEFQPGYAVFGKVSQGMDVIDSIAGVPTITVDRMRDVPEKDVIILSARRKAPLAVEKTAATARSGVESAGETSKEPQEFVAGEHFAVLERPVPTRDSARVEVVEMFSYGCPHCYEFEASIKQWSKQQPGDVDFWFFPAVWNEPMALYAQAFYTAEKLNVAEIIHHPLFTAIVVEQRKISSESELAEFFSRYGVDKEKFTKAFHSGEVETQVKHAEERVRLYKPVGVPEIIVNGKYRIDRMHAGGLKEMLAVVDYLVEKERGALKE